MIYKKCTLKKCLDEGYLLCGSTVMCLVLLPECSIWRTAYINTVEVLYECLVLVLAVLYIMVFGTCKYLEVLYNMVLGTCTWKYCTVWCLVLVPGSTLQYGAWYLFP